MSSEWDAARESADSLRPQTHAHAEARPSRTLPGGRPGRQRRPGRSLQTPRRRPPARRGQPRKQAHTREELRRVPDAAAATVRAARLRIAATTTVLERWRAG